MIDKVQKDKIADILLEFYEEYQGNMPNRPMIPRIYASKIIDSMQEEPKDKCRGCNNVKGCITCVDGSEYAHIEECDITGIKSEEVIAKLEESVEDSELIKESQLDSPDFKAALEKKVREAQDWTYIEEEGGSCPLNEEFGADDLEEFAEWGASWMREQMMKDAVKVSVNGNDDGWLTLGYLPECECELRKGDEVKVIIIKED